MIVGSTHPAVNRAPAGGCRIRGRWYRGGQILPVDAYQLNGNSSRPDDPADFFDDDTAPNLGRPIIGHAGTFQARWSNAAKVYRSPDEAIKHSRDAARIMRNDCFIRECLEARQRLTCLLNWHIEPEDPKDPRQKELVNDVTRVIQRIPHFVEYRRQLLEAMWYGKMGIENTFSVDYTSGKPQYLIQPNPWYDWGWSPINGDKIVYRQDIDDNNPRQFGIRVYSALDTRDVIAGNRKLEPTDWGMAYFLEEWERENITLHKHMIEDAAFEDAMGAGAIHGIGIRSAIYWTWIQANETLGQMMHAIERTGLGFTMYGYQDGNEPQREKVEELARSQTYQNYILVPFDADGKPLCPVEQIPANSAGIDALKEINLTLFGHRIKRYILGQTLSSESDATGLGSGVADLHLESLMQICAYDAANLDDSLSYGLVKRVQYLNRPDMKDVFLRFRSDVKETDSEKKLSAIRQAFDMGASIKESDVFEQIGLSVPTPDDKVLSVGNLQQAQQPQGQPGDMQGGGGDDLSAMFGPIVDNSQEQGGEPPMDDQGQDVQDEEAFQ